MASAVASPWDRGLRRDSPSATSRAVPRRGLPDCASPSRTGCRWPHGPARAGRFSRERRARPSALPWPRAPRPAGAADCVRP
jgi:hypothetical protein